MPERAPDPLQPYLDQIGSAHTRADDVRLAIAGLVVLGTIWVIIGSVLDYRWFALEKPIGEFVEHLDDWGGWRTAVEGQVVEIAESAFGIGDDEIWYAIVADETGSQGFTFQREEAEVLPRIGDRIRVVLMRAWYDGELPRVMGRAIDVLE